MPRSPTSIHVLKDTILHVKGDLEKTPENRTSTINDFSKYLDFNPVYFACLVDSIAS